jgi:hypothetical protein
VNCPEGEAYACEADPINPPHYAGHSIQPCEAILEWGLTYCLGSVVKYISRAGRKTADPLEDLKKARWYLEREIKRLEDGA